MKYVLDNLIPIVLSLYYTIKHVLGIFLPLLLDSILRANRLQFGDKGMTLTFADIEVKLVELRGRPLNQLTGQYHCSAAAVRTGVRERCC